MHPPPKKKKNVAQSDVKTQSDELSQARSSHEAGRCHCVSSTFFKNLTAPL